MPDNEANTFSVSALSTQGHRTAHFMHEGMLIKNSSSFVYLPIDHQENFKDYVKLVPISNDMTPQVKKVKMKQKFLLNSLLVHHNYGHAGCAALFNTCNSNQVDDFPKILNMRCPCSMCMKYKVTHIPESMKVHDYSTYPPGAFLFLDFSFYNVVSVRGFSSVLDVICASTRYPFAFPTKAQVSSLGNLRMAY